MGGDPLSSIWLLALELELPLELLEALLELPPVVEFELDVFDADVVGAVPVTADGVVPAGAAPPVCGLEVPSPPQPLNVTLAPSSNAVANVLCNFHALIRHLEN